MVFTNWLKGDLDGCRPLENGPTNVDLEGLGLVLLNCMETGKKTVRTVREVREARSTNKVFGLANAEKWSACKMLVDFLDDIFDVSRMPDLKFNRPVCINSLNVEFLKY